VACAGRQACIRLSGTFTTKKAAEMWATEKEHEIQKGTYAGAGSRTVADLFDEYAKRVSEGKLGGHWERTRFKAFKKNFPDLAAKLLTESCGRAQLAVCSGLPCSPLSLVSGE
jgi:hypothetical protein